MKRNKKINVNRTSAFTLYIMRNYHYEKTGQRSWTKVAVAFATGTDATRISTGCKNNWYLWPAAIKGKGFGTGLKHYLVPKPQYRHRLVPPTCTKRTKRNRYRLVEPTGA